jgi:ABC-type transporter Mla subunit MlaD
MKVLEYLTPENQIALWILYTLLGLFGLWLVLLLLNLVRHLKDLREIESCRNVSDLTNNITAAMSVSSTREIEDEQVFRTFQQERGLRQQGPVARHLRSIFWAGCNESQLDLRGLLKNTTDELLRSAGLQRSLLSIFIILGLLGTLFGLADTLASLDTLLEGTTQLNNDALGQSLRGLLGTLKSAFAPSIWGVSLTIIGVLLLAFYFRIVALPLIGSLERLTLTVWAPELIPTTSQKLLANLQLTERQMQRSFEAARQVAQFAEGINEKTGAFGQTLTNATTTLNQLTSTSSNLDRFSQTFIEGVKILVPFQQDLRSLYQQVADESKAFHESVRSNIEESKAFRSNIQVQLNNQHQQLTQMLSGLKSYEAAYVTNREHIDKKLGSVLVEAQRAFESLSHRNEEIAAALDESLGKPLRENLAQHLGGIQIELQNRLGEVKESLLVQLNTVAQRMSQLDDPLNKAARYFADTFSNFNETTRKLLEQVQREFGQQNEINQRQLERLESLSESVPALLMTLSDSSKNFVGASSSFATQGHHLNANVATLTEDINSLGESVDSLKEHVTLTKLVGHLDTTEQRISALIEQQMRLLQRLEKAIETLSATRRRDSSVVTRDGGSAQAQFITSRRWRDRVTGFFTGR